MGWLPPSYAPYHYFENDSSPLTQRRLRQTGLFPGYHGLIPAHAGKTCPGPPTWGDARAHPRSRGENVCVGSDRFNGAGSSPLTRGQRCRCRGRSRLRRLIPAHVGKTSPPARGSFRSTAHPRSRGENIPARSWCRVEVGSSPLTRGKRQGRHVSDGGAGLIPAHAGKTNPLASRVRSSAAHPRSRGENDDSGRARRLGLGSSPLTRGKLYLAPQLFLLCGLIPAHAGKPADNVSQWDTLEAHPRSRGENSMSPRRASIEPGSSPLTRGKPAGGGRSQEPRGLIPAHAGKTHATSTRSPCCRAHPRSRGEN